MANYDGWINQSKGADNWGTAPTMTALYRFGVGADDGAVLNTKFSQQVHQIEQNGVYSNTLQLGNKTMDSIGGVFVPVNLLPFHWLLGKTTDSTGTKTITHLDGTARNQRIATFQHTQDMKYQTLGTVVSDLVLDWRADMAALVCQINAKAQDHGKVALSPTYSYPSDIDTMYNHLTMTWNGAAVKPIKFNATLGRTLGTFISGSTGKYSRISEFNPVIGGYTLQFIASEGETIFDDFDTGTKRSLVTRLDKADNAHYFTITNDVYINDVNVERVYGFPVYTVSCVTEDINIVGTDGVANSFYGL